MRFTLSKRFKLHHAQGIVDAGRDVHRRGFLHTQAEGDVFKHRHVRKQRIALKDGVHMAVFRRDMGDIVIFEMDLAAIDAFQSGDKTKNGCFTAARGAKQGEKLTVVDGQIEVGDNRFTIKAFANSRQLNQRRTRTRLCIQFSTLSHVDAAESLPMRGLWLTTFGFAHKIIRPSILRQTIVIAND